MKLITYKLNLQQKKNGNLNLIKTPKRKKAKEEIRGIKEAPEKFGRMRKKGWDSLVGF